MTAPSVLSIQQPITNFLQILIRLQTIRGTYLITILAGNQTNTLKFFSKMEDTSFSEERIINNQVLIQGSMLILNSGMNKIKNLLNLTALIGSGKKQLSLRISRIIKSLQVQRIHLCWTGISLILTTIFLRLRS